MEQTIDGYLLETILGLRIKFQDEEKFKNF